MLLKAFTWHDEIANRLTLNRQAREVMHILAEGGRSTTAGTDATTNIYGMHQRKTAPAGTLRTNYRLQYTSNGKTLLSSQMAAMTVPCTGAARPLPDCVDASQTKTVDGWVASDVSLNSTTRSVGTRTTEVVVTLANPFAAQRQENPAEAVERYRTILTRMRDDADP
jgi:hypothetical protein